MYSTEEIDAEARRGLCRFLYPQTTGRPAVGSVGRVFRNPGAAFVCAFSECQGGWTPSDDRAHKMAEAIIAKRLLSQDA